jgi:hypothetical protein
VPQRTPQDSESEGDFTTPQEETTDYLVFEERKFRLLKDLSADFHFKRLTTHLPYTTEQLLGEALRNHLATRPLHLALQMHFQMIVACCIAEVTTSSLELSKLANVFKTCHTNLMILVQLAGVKDPRLAQT